MGSLDREQMRCCTSTSLLRPSCVDRLTSLPDELLTRILSMLPTKEAAATQVLSKRMRRPFCWITSIDLDDSLISHCVQSPHVFEPFIDNVLHKLSQSQQPLTRFRLRLVGKKQIWYPKGHKCKQAYCFPNPEAARLYAWISYPLAHRGLRELDLCFHVRHSSECKLPPEIFALKSLEVLRLDINLEINGNNEIPIICLPNLKLLHLRSFVFTEDEFITRLVSDCPVLEDLSIICCWLKADRLIVTSNSLRRFVFDISKYCNYEENSNLVHIDTPNLQYFEYSDSIALNYITHFTALVEASIDVLNPWPIGTVEISFRKQLSLLRALSNVKHLTLYGWSIKGFYYASKLRDPLPMFRNLRTLKLDELCDVVCRARWDLVLLLIFHRAPLLEELVFQSGFFYWGEYTCNIHEAAWEAASWIISQTTIPPCCEFHLKQIEIYRCHGRDQELNMMKFLLGKASVLKKFVISMSKTPTGGIILDAPKFDEFKKAVENIPRASNSCSIIYSNDEPNFN